MKNLKYLFIPVILVATFLLIGQIISKSAQAPSDKETPVTTIEPQPDYNREYKLGISGYSPANFPDSTSQEATTYWQEVNANSQVYGVHIDWHETDFIQLASAMYDHDISLVLGYQDSAEWGIKREEFLTKAKELLKTNSKIKYLAIGNEVNLLYEKDTVVFEKFVSDYKYFYKELKKEYPSLKVYTVFNYESLIGAGYLFGPDILHKSSTSLITTFNDSIDLIGLTSYPYFDYKSPAVIPADYFLSITSLSDKPIALTETGWMSRSAYGTKYKAIDELGLSGSEAEQVEYLSWLITKTSATKFEFINWIFLNDPFAWENGVDPSQYVSFDSVGLKLHNGSKKAVWTEWKSLFME